MNYSYQQTLIKGLKYFVIFVVPFLVDQFIVNYPGIAQLTVGGVLVLLVDYLKNKVGVRFL